MKSSAKRLTDFQRDPLRRRRLLVALATLGVLGAAFTFESHRLLSDPQVFFLRNEAGAQWIRVRAPFVLIALPAVDTEARFECVFRTSRTVNDARLTVRAFRRCRVMLDGRTIFEEDRDFENWQQPRELRIAGPLPPGIHQLQIAVFNHAAQPCLLAWSDELEIRTGPLWFTIQGDGRLSPAALTSDATMPQESLAFPRVADAFLSVWGWLAGLFVVVFGWNMRKSRRREAAGEHPLWQLSPGRLRWILLAAWTLLAVNNIAQLAGGLGFDAAEHLQYVEYIARRHALPLATEGWQMFQPPLFYLLEAPLYAVLKPRLSEDALLHALRVLPLLCGLAQIEIVYRVARAIFPQSEDLQAIALVVGGLLPMQMTICQFIGNEPLAGCLTGLVLLFCVWLLTEPAKRRGLPYFVLLGFVWGLAILSKVTPLLVAPLVAAALALHWKMSESTRRAGLLRAALVFGACLLTSGWYFARNWAAFGKPFVAGSFDPVIAQTLWQFPSYRTWDQLTSFGPCLSRPIYRQVWSLWDGLYSSMWLDGFVSDTIVGLRDFPWNLQWMLAGAWLALVPMGLLLASPATCWRREFRPARGAILLAMAVVGVYLAAVVDLYVRLPIYSAAKATYLLGLVPCIAVLAAVGAAPLLRFRVSRALVLSAVTCWGVASYVAYFDFAAIRSLLGGG